MKLKLHRGIKRDVRLAVEWYDRKSDRAGNEFITEVNQAFDSIAANPERFHFTYGSIRRCNLKRFPYHVLFEEYLMCIHVLAVKHHKRHPRLGLRRRMN
jgi:plasmid stabilization system protein ParE